MSERKAGRPTVASERTDAMRRLMRSVVQAEFNGNQAAAAKAMRFTPATLSNFLAGKTQAGPKIEDGLTGYLRRSVDQIMATGGDLAALRGGTEAPTPMREVRFGDLPSWPELYASARTLRPQIPRWAWQKTARARVLLDVPITGAFIAGIAAAIHEHTEPEPNVGDDSTIPFPDR